jgi:hypothetical protein
MGSGFESAKAATVAIAHAPMTPRMNLLALDDCTCIATFRSYDVLELYASTST